jgi:hypothetical protein
VTKSLCCCLLPDRQTSVLQANYQTARTTPARRGLHPLQIWCVTGRRQACRHRASPLITPKQNKAVRWRCQRRHDTVGVRRRPTHVKVGTWILYGLQTQASGRKASSSALALLAQVGAPQGSAGHVSRWIRWPWVDHGRHVHRRDLRFAVPVRRVIQSVTSTGVSWWVTQSPLSRALWSHSRRWADRCVGVRRRTGAAHLISCGHPAAEAGGHSTRRW